MERIEQKVGQSEYEAYQHFISNSNRGSKVLQVEIAIRSSKILASHKETSKLPTGYIVDESAHLKKGVMSVGVARQDAGVSGKVDNCQVGVYASLVNEKYATIISERLFLPSGWTDSVD